MKPRAVCFRHVARGPGEHPVDPPGLSPFRPMAAAQIYGNIQDGFQAELSLRGYFYYSCELKKWLEKGSSAFIYIINYYFIEATIIEFFVVIYGRCLVRLLVGGSIRSRLILFGNYF